METGGHGQDTERGSQDDKVFLSFVEGLNIAASRCKQRPDERDSPSGSVAEDGIADDASDVSGTATVSDANRTFPSNDERRLICIKNQIRRFQWENERLRLRIALASVMTREVELLRRDRNSTAG